MGKIKTVTILSAEQTIAVAGLKRGRPPSEYSEFVPVREDIPPRVDLRQWCSPIESQGQSNSCTANSVVGAYEYLARRAGQDGDVSRLFVYYMARKQQLDEYGLDTPVADTGAGIGFAIDAMMQHGTCLATTWPFDLEKVNEPPVDEAWDEAMGYRATETKKVPMTLEGMKGSLAEGHPFVFGIKMTKQMYNPGPKGFCKCPGPDNALVKNGERHALHAMLAVGYSDKQEVFIVRNSWGDWWGDKGYCYIPYKFMCNPKYRDPNCWSIHGLTDFDLSPEHEADDEDVTADDEQGVDEGDFEELDDDVDDGHPDDEPDDDDACDHFEDE